VHKAREVNMKIEDKIRQTIYDFLAEDERFYGKQDGTESITEIPERLIKELSTLTQESNKEAVRGFETLKSIDGFVGFNIDGGGVWYALFDVESAFWTFLNRNSMSRSMERPLNPVGRYCYRNSEKITELVAWLNKEYQVYLSSKETDNEK
jgi:hypothetical protein